MTRLSALNLPSNTARYHYDRSAVTAGIVHFGIGNFHRAHQAVYVDDLLNQGQTQWGITGVSLRSSAMKDALAPQDYLYNLATLGKTTEYRIIGSILNILVAPKEPDAVIDLLASAATQLVSSTITEKGYYLGPKGVNFDHPNLQEELSSLAKPKTIYGFLARGLIQRRQTQDSSRPNNSHKITIMCCDNISGGGEFLRQGVEYLLMQHSPATLEWSQGNAVFISSMVDRVCPATDDALRTKVLNDTGCQDAWPVSTEPFRQWIIEKNFAGQRPEFDKVGAVFVDSIVPFEQMKLRYLNCAHTIISTLGYLSGDSYVHETLKRSDILKFTRQALYKNVLPHANVPDGYDGAAYIESVIERFQNSHLPYGNLQVGTDSSQKIQQRWFPTIDKALSNNADTSYFEYSLGAWIIFIKTALENDVLNDPKAAGFKGVTAENLEDITLSYLRLANAEAYKFYHTPQFISAVKNHAKDIQANGIMSSILSHLWIYPD